MLRGFYVTSDFNERFMTGASFLNRNELKRELPYFYDYRMLGSKIEVEGKIGWISKGYHYGAEGHGEIMIIYRGGTPCAFGVQKDIVKYI